MAPPKRAWFWGLLVALGGVFLLVTLVAYRFFETVPWTSTQENFQTVQLEPEITAEPETRLPMVLPPAEEDRVGDRLPADTRWVLELQGLRSLALDLQGEVSGLNGLDIPEGWSRSAAALKGALPFDSSDPLAWIRSGYDLVSPWALAQVSEGPEDSGAWILLLPIRDPEAARLSTRSLLKAWDLDSRPVAWTWDQAYHLVVIEEDHRRAPAARLEQLARDTREGSFALAGNVQAMAPGLGGGWTLRFRGHAATPPVLPSEAETGRSIGWPLGHTGGASMVGLTLRLARQHQRLRLTRAGGGQVENPGGEGVSADSEPSQEISAEMVRSGLDLDPAWWSALHDAGPEVRGSLERVQWKAEAGPSGLVLDLRTQGRLEDWEPVVHWWMSTM